VAKPAPRYYPLFFGPDLDPAWAINPGVLTDVADMVPSKRGTLKTYASTTSQDISAGTFSESTYGTCLSGCVQKKIDGTGRMFVGTTTRLMENTGASWSDRSAGATDYTTAANWDFTTFGNDVIAVSKANAPQVSNSTTFAALSGSPPKASVCTTNKNFVLLGDCDNGTDNLGDQIWWSGLGNDATWAASAATQAGNYRLLDSPGNVTALENMRDAVIAYKEDSVYVGDYQGSPLLWTWRLVSDKVGCAAMHGIAVVDGIHYFLHRTGVYRFDGASVQPIGQPVNRYLFDKMASQVNYATAQAAYDEYEGLVLWYFHDTGAASNERRYALAFNPTTGNYGFVKLAWATGTCRAVIKATLSDLTAWSSGQATQSNNVVTIGIESSVAQLRRAQFAGSASGATMSFTTGDIGDDILFSKLERIKPRALSFYTTSMTDATVYGKASEGDSYDSGTTYTQDTARSRWDGEKSNRWLQIKLTFNDHAEIAGLYLTSTLSGTE
jgi:hypothetical protein